MYSLNCIFSYWIQIWQWKFEVRKFLKKVENSRLSTALNSCVERVNNLEQKTTCFSDHHFLKWLSAEINYYILDTHLTLSFLLCQDACLHKLIARLDISLQIICYEADFITNCRHKYVVDITVKKHQWDKNKLLVLCILISRNHYGRFFTNIKLLFLLTNTVKIWKLL